MPFRVRSSCPRCRGGDLFVIGNWPEHLGVYACSPCRALVNVPVEGEACPGCSTRPAPDQFYDYSGSIPYLEGQFPGVAEPGPRCPRCSAAPVNFETIAHLNLGMVVFHPAASAAAGRRDHLERAIFERSLLPVCEELQLEPGEVFSYFHLPAPGGRPTVGRPSYPITLDIRTHLKVKLMTGGFTRRQSSAVAAAPGGFQLATPLGTLTFDTPATPVNPPATPAAPDTATPPPAPVWPAPAPRPAAPAPPPAQAPTRSEPPAMAGLRQKIEACLHELGLTFQVDSGRYVLRRGSAVVFVQPAEWSGRTVVQLIAPVAVACASITPELALQLAIKNSELVFGKFSIVRGRQMILFEHALLGDSLDPPEFMQALISVAAIADQHDEEVARLAGGKRMTEA